jgi:Fe-S oxidoreductase
MSVREGNLEAPMRHPLNWQHADFYDEEKLLEEEARVFDVCHGCRRCFNLCNAFPTLFDLIDNTEGGELAEVDRKAYSQVVDQCYLCDICFMTKCPYVPPHPLNVDFPHLMLRAKAVQFKKGKSKFRDKLLTSTDLMGKLMAIPVVAETVNTLNRNQMARKALEKILGIAAERKLPPYTPHPFRKNAKIDTTFPVKDGSKTPGKVAIFSTCYINYNEPDIGHDLLKILVHNEIPVTFAEKERCCGMPKLELGDLDTVQKLKEQNIPQLLPLAKEGYAILAPVPSCSLMFKSELPLLFPDDEDVKTVANAFFDPFEYFYGRYQDGLLKTDFQKGLGKITYHIPCHLRVQNLGQKTKDMLALIPDTEVIVVERCSGHDGTWGVKKEFFETSMKIGKPLFQKMKDGQCMSSDCPIAIRQIDQGTEGAAPSHHPLTLLRMAYGLQ